MKCNLCGGDEVQYMKSVDLYGRNYGSGYIYRCKQCGAYTGTHKSNPRKPLGILADAEMRKLRCKCHSIFDHRWHNRKERSEEYRKLAARLGLPEEECHFAKMDKETLKKALEVLEEGRNK